MDVAEYLRGDRSQFRRMERVRELFRRDLQILLAEGFIEKVRPNRSPRSHYFRIRNEPSSEST